MSFWHAALGAHQWSVEAAQPGVLRLAWDKTGYSDSNVTTVLYRCSECGTTKTAQLQGFWNLDQLRGELGATTGSQP